MLDLGELVATYDMKINGVLHVGAHLAEEASTYHDLGAGNVTWVEANPAVMPQINEVLAHYPGQRVIQALVYSEDGAWLDFNVTNFDGMSSSILEFGDHRVLYPDTVFVDKVKLHTSTIDSIADVYGVAANFLLMDIQGAELHALKGATRFLQSVDYVMSEVNDAEVYVDCAKVWELDAVLAGFERVATHWVGDQHWGDGLWVRRQG